MATLEEVIGTALTDSWYDQQEEYDREMERAFTNMTRFRDVRVIGTSDDFLGQDMEMCQAIHADLEALVFRAEGGQSVDARRFDDMLDALSIAVHVLSCDNDALDSAFVVGIGKLFVMLPWAVLKAKATKLEKSLKELDALLKQAQKEQVESYGQLVINAAIVGVMVATGPTSLLIIGGVAVGQMVLDTAIGANTSDAATWGSRGSTTSGAVASVLENAEKAGTQTKTIAKVAGKSTIVIGFVFDVNEIYTAHVNVDGLETAMKKAKKELDELKAEIKRNRPKLDAFIMALKVWEKNMSALDETATDARIDLQNLMQQTGYFPQL